MRRSYAVLLLCLIASAARAAVAPVSESQQAALALKIMDAWHGDHHPGPPKKLHIVYYTPADRQPEPRYRERLEAIMEDIRTFYRDGMERAGFGPETFDLDRDAQGKWILHFVQGKLLESAFSTWEGRAGTGSADAGDKVRAECKPTLEAAGIFDTNETVLIFCNLANWDEKALSKWDLEMALEPRLETNWFGLSTNLSGVDLAPRKGALRVEGTVLGTPPVYAVIGYFDSSRDGGYSAPTATTVPNAQGRFAIEISDLAPTDHGQLRLQYCHANGGVSEVRTPLVISRGGQLDLSQAEMRNTLDPVGLAVASGRLEKAEAALQKLEASQVSDLTKEIARTVVAALKPDRKPTPAEAASSLTQLSLGDARAESAEVGWLRPSSNRLPPNPEVESPFLDSGKIYATGLYAHSPSRYVFDLGGKWKNLRGEAGLETQHQDRAAGVVFVIKSDGKEVFRSKVIREVAKVSYDLDVSNVKTLELIVLKATANNACNWGLWLDPKLSR